MVTENSPRTLELPSIYKLPKEFIDKIGHVIVAFSYLEYLLSRIIYDLLNVGQKEGRLAVREPRATDRLDIIIDLLNIKEIKVDVDIDAISQLLDDVQSRRNNIAHGVWLEHPNTGQIFLRLTRGSWQPDPKIRGKVKKTIHPEGREYGEPELSQLCNDIDGLTEGVIDLAKEVVVRLPALRKKYLEQDQSE